MTGYELLSTLVSAIAAVISIVAMIRTRKINAAMLRLEEIHAELSKKQIEQIEKDKQEQSRAKLKVELVKHSSTSYKFHITNMGSSSAKNINFSLTQDCDSNPLVMNEYTQKIPYPMLNAGDYFTLIAAINFDMSSSIFPVRLFWKNEDGTQGNLECAPSI